MAEELRRSTHATYKESLSIFISEIFFSFLFFLVSMETTRGLAFFWLQHLLILLILLLSGALHR